LLSELQPFALLLKITPPPLHLAAAAAVVAAAARLINYKEFMKTFYYLLLFCSFVYAEHCTFVPPQGWEIAQLKNPSPHVKIGFLGKGSSEFRPSINLATEAGVETSLKGYVKAVKEQHKADSGTGVRDLGAFPMKCGNGQLIELTSPSPCGPIRILQALFVKEGTAYILTAAALKSEFVSLQKELLQSFSTLTFTDDLFSEIPDAKKRENFTAFFNTLGKEEKEENWKKLQQRISEFADLGAYWVFLVLQEGHAKIYATN